MTSFAILEARFPDQFAANASLARYTVARLGGSAAGVLRVRSREELTWAAQWAIAEQVQWLVIGGGANVLASDAGFNGLLIVNQAKNYQIDPKTGQVEADSGVNLSTLARLCMGEGLQGLEWGVSVPGTVGGAIVNNAGAHGGEMAGNLRAATIFDLTTNQSEVWPVSQLEYAYRHSVLKGQHGRYMVLGGVLQLAPNHDPAELNAIADGFIEHRKRTQPPGASLGSMFKNPPNDYAGRLIEAAGLKGHRIGGVQISPVHANFFVNVGKGTAADYDALIQLAQTKVREQFGVELELEVERIGDWG